MWSNHNCSRGSGGTYSTQSPSQWTVFSIILTLLPHQSKYVQSSHQKSVLPPPESTFPPHFFPHHKSLSPPKKLKSFLPVACIFTRIGNSWLWKLVTGKMLSSPPPTRIFRGLTRLLTRRHWQTLAGSWQSPIRVSGGLAF